MKVLIVILLVILFILYLCPNFVKESFKSSNKKIINRLKNEIKAEVRPSKIQGVGVFAITDIPKNKVIFKNVDKDFITIKKKKLDKLTPEQRRVFTKLSDCQNNKFYTSKNFNILPITSFLNHSDEPNIMLKEESDEWISTKNIKKDDEILWDYTQTNDLKFKKLQKRSKIQ